ncbi:MAG: methyl-accepting chemotaxis protein [Candidatus Omnitrophica bacterium]|nr:methyl-accepting chemotaxis protein [Candidatus Omnitrophota bacterium]
MKSDIRAKRQRRIRYLIARRFQFRFVALILAFVFLSAALSSLVVYYTMMMLMGEKLANVYPQGMLLSIINTLNTRIILAVLIISPLVVLLGILLSFRIVGPIYRISKLLRLSARGDLSSRITVRAKDEFKALADAINDMTDMIKTSVKHQKLHAEKAAAEVESIKNAVNQEGFDKDRAKDIIEKLSSEIAEINKELSRYKL